MGEVLNLPPRPITGDEMAELLSASRTGLLSREDLLTGPLDEIWVRGPLVATGDLADRLLRVSAIVHAMEGPGRVGVSDGVHAAITLLEEIHAHAAAEAMGSARSRSSRQVKR